MREVVEGRADRAVWRNLIVHLGSPCASVESTGEDLGKKSLMCVARRLIETIECGKIHVGGPLTLSDEKGSHTTIPSLRKAVAEKGLGGMHGLDTNPIDDPYIKGVELDIEVGLCLPSPIEISEVAIRGASEDTDEGRDLFGGKLIWMGGSSPSIVAEKPDFTCKAINHPGIRQEFGVCKGAHEGLQNNRRRSLNVNAVGPGDGSSHSVEFKRMNRCELCSIENCREKAVSYDRAMRHAAEDLAAFPGSLVKHKVANCSGAEEPFRGSRIKSRLTVGVASGRFRSGRC
jgi:hypothetical protein